MVELFENCHEQFYKNQDDDEGREHILSNGVDFVLVNRPNIANNGEFFVVGIMPIF